MLLSNPPSYGIYKGTKQLRLSVKVITHKLNKIIIPVLNDAIFQSKISPFRHTVQKIRRKGTGDTPILPFCGFATRLVPFVNFYCV